MSAKYDTVLDLKVVTDHDCGNYTIGDIECFGAYGGEIRTFLQNCGGDGRDHLLTALTFCIYRIHVISEAPQATTWFGTSSEGTK